MDIKKLTAPANSAAQSNAAANSTNVKKAVQEVATNSIFDDNKPKAQTMPSTKLLDSDEKPKAQTMPSIQLLTPEKEPDEIDNFFEKLLKQQQPKIKAKRTKVETVKTEEGEKTVTTVEDVEISVDEYKQMVKDKLEGKEPDPNVSYEFDEDSVSEAMWKTSDKDGNGYIDENEYKELLGSILDIDNIENIDDLIKNSDILNKLLNDDKDIDANGDGKFSRDEFNNSVLNHILAEDKAEAEAAAEGEEAAAAAEAETPEAATEAENSAATTEAENPEAATENEETLFDKFLGAIKGFFDDLEKDQDNVNEETQPEADEENKGFFQDFLDKLKNSDIFEKIKEFFKNLQAEAN